MAGTIQRSSLHGRLRARALRILQAKFEYFLRLPPEIRLQIYEIILACAIDRKSPQPLALLRVSKQVFREYREIALGHIRPTFDRACDVYTYWRVIGPRLRRHVKHIKLIWTARKNLSEICSVVELPWFHLRTLTIDIHARRSDSIPLLLNELCFQLRFVDSVDIVRIMRATTSSDGWFNPTLCSPTENYAFRVISDMSKRDWCRPRQDTLQCCKWLRGIEVGQRDLGLQTLAYTLTRRAALKGLGEIDGPAMEIDAVRFMRYIMPSLQEPSWWLLWYPSPSQIQFGVRVYE